MQLIIIAALTLTTLSGRWGSAGPNLALCLAAALWSLLALHPGLRKRSPVMAVFVAGVIAISFVLVIRDPWFGFYAYAGYSYSILLLPWPWQLLGVAGIAFTAATSETSGENRTTPLGVLVYLGVIAATTGVSCGLTWFVHRIVVQHEERGRLLDELREANRKLEEAMAENAGLQRQLLTQAREAGVFDERQRMAREIHDTMAQGLIGIITQLQAAEHTADDPVEWGAHFAAATRLARESLSEARRSVNALRPEPLETGRLGEALADVARRWSELHGVGAAVVTTGTVRPMPAGAEVALLRMAQEALANVARHAAATEVRVTLSYLEHEVALDVRDDGRGFDPSLAASGEAGPPRDAGTGGFGLVAMRQRIEALSGTVQVESEPGAGTGISARVPAGRAEAPA
jgi:signal transduction histidine kinase